MKSSYDFLRWLAGKAALAACVAAVSLSVSYVYDDMCVAPRTYDMLGWEDIHSFAQRGLGEPSKAQLPAESISWAGRPELGQEVPLRWIRHDKESLPAKVIDWSDGPFLPSGRIDWSDSAGSLRPKVVLATGEEPVVVVVRRPGRFVTHVLASADGHETRTGVAGLAEGRR